MVIPAVSNPIASAKSLILPVKKDMVTITSRIYPNTSTAFCDLYRMAESGSFFRNSRLKNAMVSRMNIAQITYFRILEETG